MLPLGVESGTSGTPRGAFKQAHHYEYNNTNNSNPGKTESVKKTARKQRQSNQRHTGIKYFLVALLFCWVSMLYRIIVDTEDEEISLLMLHVV